MEWKARILWIALTSDSTTVERYISGNEILDYEWMLMEWMNTNSTKINNTLNGILH